MAYTFRNKGPAHVRERMPLPCSKIWARNTSQNINPLHLPQHRPRTRPTTWIPNMSHDMGLEHVPQHGPSTHAYHLGVLYRSNSALGPTKTLKLGPVFFSQGSSIYTFSMSGQQTMELKRQRSNVHNTGGCVVTAGTTTIATT